eukprot:388940_1
MHLIRCNYRNGKKRCGLRETSFDGSFQGTPVCHKHHCDYKGHCFGCSTMLPHWTGHVFPYCGACSYRDVNADGVVQMDSDSAVSKYRQTSDFVIWEKMSKEKYENYKLFRK